MSSSRRSTGEINILAMLDGRAPGRRLLALPAAFWYGAAGLLACSLLVALAWLVRDAPAARDPETAGAARPLPQPGAAARDAVLSAGARATAHGTADENANDSAHDSATARGAAIVEVAPAAPASAVAITAAAPTAATSTAATSTAATSTAAIPTRSTRAGRPAAPTARPQPGYRTPQPHAPALAHAGQASSRQKRTAGSRTAPGAAVDTDVALISAILQHNGTRNESTGGAGGADAAGTGACVDKPCGSRMPSRQ